MITDKNLKNCQLPKEFYEHLHPDEVSILEGMLFPYSQFGGSFIILNEPQDVLAFLKENNLLDKFLEVLNSTKIYGDIEYVDGNDIIELRYNLFYKRVGEKFIESFRYFHEYLIRYKEVKYLKEANNFIPALKDFLKEKDVDVSLWKNISKKFNELSIHDMLINKEFFDSISSGRYNFNFLLN